MYAQKYQVVVHKKETLDALAETVILPEKFMKIGNSYVANYPILANRKFHFRERDLVNWWKIIYMEPLLV